MNEHLKNVKFDAIIVYNYIFLISITFSYNQ